jgi:4-hydroxy-3-polyprenylbenzoate decarboxylase
MAEKSMKQNNTTIGSKLCIDAMKKLPGEGFKRAWLPFIKMDEAVNTRVAKILNL